MFLRFVPRITAYNYSELLSMFPMPACVGVLAPLNPPGHIQIIGAPPSVITVKPCLLLNPCGEFPETECWRNVIMRQ